MTERTFVELVRECADLANSKGFDVCTLDNFPGKCMLVLTEVVEFMDEAEDNRDWTTDPHVHMELADILIRMTVMYYQTFGAEEFKVRGDMRPSGGTNFDLESYPKFVLKLLTTAVQAWRKNELLRCQGLTLMAIEYTIGFSHRHGIDWFKAMTEKTEINRPRPPLNGKVRTLG